MKVCPKCDSKLQDNDHLCEYCGNLILSNDVTSNKKNKFNRIHFLKVFDHNENMTVNFDDNIHMHLMDNFGVGKESYGYKEDLVDNENQYFITGEIKDVVAAIQLLSMKFNINIAVILEYNLYDIPSSKIEQINQDEAIYYLNYYVVVDNEGTIHVNQSANYGVGHSEFLGFYRFECYDTTFFTPKHITYYDYSALDDEIIEYLESEENEIDDDIYEMIQIASGELSYEIAEETNDKDINRFKALQNFSGFKTYSVTYI